MPPILSIVPLDPKITIFISNHAITKYLSYFTHNKQSFYH